MGGQTCLSQHGKSMGAKQLVGAEHHPSVTYISL